MNGLSKRLVSLTMATAMVFSLTAVPATEAKAATASITSKTTSVQVGKTYTYKIKASKAKKVKVSVSGTAAKAVRVNGKKATSGITLKGGKTVTVKVKVNPSKTVAGKKFTINYKLDKKKAVKTKSIKVNYSTKGVTLDQTALTMKAGETATLKATMTTVGTNSKIKDWSSSNEAVATVKDGVVTAVAAGTADITVKTSNGKTATATVTVEGEKKANLQMTSLTAPAADTLKATFAESVPANEAITITRSKSTAGFTGIATWNADRTELTYKLDSNLVADVYTMTVKVGEDSTSLTYEATARKATAIEILGETALTNKNKDAVYVYYDVKDQYGESVRTSTSVTITTSTGRQTVDRSTGKITVNAVSANTFKYGDIVSVTVVDTKDGLSQSKVLNVGLEQQVDSVEVAGFISKDEPTKLLDRLPKNFAKNNYYVLYQAKDQQKNLMDNDSTRLQDVPTIGKQLTVTVSDPMLIDSTFTDDGKSFTIDGVTYDSFKINPGQYSDKGGEAALTIISNKTGTKTPFTVIVDDAGVLQSFALDAPSGTFADGENTKLTYKAKDTKGNDITSFETIVRSTNTLNLNASIGTLTIYEGNDGEAIVKFADSYGTRDLDDGIDMPVVLTTIVVGGETNYQQFGISDYAYPVAFKEIHTNRWTDTIVYGGSETIDFKDTDNDGSVKYVDQYGRVMSGLDAYAHINTVNDNPTFDTTLAIVMDTAGVSKTDTGATGNFGLDETVYVAGEANTYATINQDYTDVYNANDISDSIRFYIGTTENSKKTNPTFADLNAVGSQKTVTYTCVGYNKVKNIGINSIKTLHVSDKYSSYGNLADYNSKTGATTVSGNAPLATAVVNPRDVVVVGTANSEKVYLPETTYWTVSGNGVETASFTVAGGKITGVAGLKVSDLYNTATATGDRKSRNATLTLALRGVDPAEPTKIAAAVDTLDTTITIGDADSVATTVEFYDGWNTKLTDKAIVDPTAMKITSSVNGDNNLVFGSDMHDWKDLIVVKFFDQYGDLMDYNTLDDAKININNMKENTAELAHVANSLGTLSNNTKSTSVTGAEIKDVFTFTVSSGNAKGSLEVTVGGDQHANTDINPANGKAYDYNFRTGVLKYTDR